MRPIERVSKYTPTAFRCEAGFEQLDGMKGECSLMSETDVDTIHSDGEMVCEQRDELKERILIDHLRRFCLASVL